MHASLRNINIGPFLSSFSPLQSYPHSGPLKSPMKEERGFYLIHFVLPYNPIILFTRAY